MDLWLSLQVWRSSYRCEPFKQHCIFSGFWYPDLTELDTALIKDPFDEQLEEAVPTRPEACLAQLPVRRDELSHHSTGFLEAVDARRARVPVFEFCVVGEARQGEEQTKLAVVVLGRAVLLQTVETLDCLLHGELQLT